MSRKIPSSEITPEDVYLSRRKFLSVLGLAAGSSLLAACGVDPSGDVFNPEVSPFRKTPTAGPSPTPEPLTAFEDITSVVNFYEFSPEKSRVAGLAEDFRTSPWSIEIGGLVHKPKTLSIEDILNKYPREERIYRMRCVERWSMIIPWLGFPLNKILQEVEPMSSAAFVRFVTLMDLDQMPGQGSSFFPWPYTEGLRLDEAMHDLTILSTGLYGKELLPQNGAPLRLVVPWKYGFKSIKSIVKIELTTQQPQTFWNTYAPNEYGFFANVNPNIQHPRWLQSTEYRVGVNGLQPTQFMNGYADEVAHLYDGMDLGEFF